MGDSLSASTMMYDDRCDKIKRAGSRELLQCLIDLDERGCIPTSRDYFAVGELGHILARARELTKKDKNYCNL